jgi:hypothetical protein
MYRVIDNNGQFFRTHKSFKEAQRAHKEQSAFGKCSIMKYVGDGDWCSVNPETGKLRSISLY